MNIEKRFGERVRELRKKHNISQEELSFRAGLHKNYVSDVECAAPDTNPSASFIFTIIIPK